ncbi:Glutamate synthase [NADPH] small chain [Indibacter alkaliphilus LW1]|jgi:glutamate synthase (NADPH/NADH) small chain|uniref:Glutamate synthase [NADPH] small chain n=1 Tax=Indibacter alkaliphilus (strain CCUG 57479 / KCTC 22604 / LW1) TaxID=1189612 RepID=S2CZE3_INDAL|nr:glutamate synthase subunit beta [Indibacter alkaliphilus]EOZ91984.1 Glutamate synthase [NADPH] small chain [Indibacter alkaliphilus LW1]
MGAKEGFIKYKRELPQSRKPEERVQDYNEIYQPFDGEKLNNQAARCMDCGIPFCHQGCPLGNVIPDFNDAVYRNEWEEAFHILKSTNNFPEFTGRICPAPCEASCVLGINKDPVTIELIEKHIAEQAYEKGYVKANPPKSRTGKKVAVIGSGPAGLAAADQLNQAGHEVTVFEKDAKVGGLLRYGIPDFKLEKWVIDRRTAIMEEEGVIFSTGTDVGFNIKAENILRNFDAVLLATGAQQPRELNIKGSDLNGVHFAMEFLGKQNQVIGGEIKENPISAKDKHVIVIGGGDTGSDCIGTSNRHGAKSITQLELLPKPPKQRTILNPWPEWPMTLKTSSSHEEGADRVFSILTKEFIGNEKGEVTGLTLVDIEWKEEGGRMQFEEVAGTERTLPCDLAFLAIGYTGPAKNGLLEAFGVETMENSLPKSKEYQSTNKKVFLSGDMRRGQSLVVWAISEGREAAVKIDEFLMGTSSLPKKDEGYYEVEEDMLSD